MPPFHEHTIEAVQLSSTRGLETTILRNPHTLIHVPYGKLQGTLAPTVSSQMLTCNPLSQGLNSSQYHVEVKLGSPMSLYDQDPGPTMVVN